MIHENLLYSDYLIAKKRKSKIDPEATITSWKMRCPKCKEIQPDIDHGETRQCACGLKMTMYGNSLSCELEGFD